VAGELTVAPCRWIDAESGVAEAYVVSFDGSYREGRAGAAAVLWGPVDGAGGRRILASATARCEAAESALVAEAQACRLALWLATYRLPPAQRRVILAGDNRYIVDHGRSRRRLRIDGVQLFVDRHIVAAEAHGRALEWVLLPRLRNQAAHRLAGAARLAGAPTSHEWAPMP
jgi:hypothetical protein